MRTWPRSRPTRRTIPPRSAAPPTRLRAGNAGLVVMDCIGFRRKTRDEIAALTGAPTLVANLLVARVAAELLGR